MNETLERPVTPREVPPARRPPLAGDAPRQLARRDPSPRPIAAANDSLPTKAPPTGLDRESARWLPLVVPGFALLVLLVCGALVWAMAL